MEVQDLNLGLSDKVSCSVPEHGMREGWMGMVVAIWKWRNRSDTTGHARDLG